MKLIARCLLAVRCGMFLLPFPLVAAWIAYPSLLSPRSLSAVEETTPPPLPAGVTPEMVEHGRVLFHGVGRCVRCHGKNGTGTNRGTDFTARKWLHTHGEYDEIVHVVTNGVPKPKQHDLPMPPKGGSQMTPEQIREVAAYVWSISH